jgi:hypothetical protein
MSNFVATGATFNEFTTVTTADVTYEVWDVSTNTLFAAATNLGVNRTAGTNMFDAYVSVPVAYKIIWSDGNTPALKAQDVGNVASGGGGGSTTIAILNPFPPS